MSSIPSPYPEKAVTQRSSKARWSLKRAGARRIGAWARKRQGTDPLVVSLRSRRIYIVPTGVGLLFALMTLAMLLGSMNYNNNLSFVLTFLLIGTGFVAMHQCQRNLVGLEMRYAGTEPVFAGQTIEFRIAVVNNAKNTRCGICLYTDECRTEHLDLRPGESRLFVLPVTTNKRGFIVLPRFGVKTLFPLELFRAWSWLHMDLQGLVYPGIAENAPPPPPSRSALGHRQHDARGEEDFAGLKTFQDGDSPRHVAWKAYARSDQLLTKQFSGADVSSQWFDFETVPSADPERRLSILTRWVEDAHRSHRDYGLRLPEQAIGPAHGDAHRRFCLKQLALFGLDVSGND